MVGACKAGGQSDLYMEGDDWKQDATQGLASIWALLNHEGSSRTTRPPQIKIHVENLLAIICLKFNLA